MKTPKTVRIGKLRYKVHKLKALPKHHGVGSGYIDYVARSVSVATHSKNGAIRYTKKQVDLAFWHEIVHGILNDMRQHRLNGNERFVEGFAERLSDIVSQFERRKYFTGLVSIDVWQRRQARQHLAMIKRIGAREEARRA